MKTKKELGEIFSRNAAKRMASYNEAGFKKKFKTLYHTIIESMNEIQENSNRELVDKLKQNLIDMEWMVENLHKPHTPDHFNIPANAIESTRDLLFKHQSPGSGDGGENG